MSIMYMYTVCDTHDINSSSLSSSASSSSSLSSFSSSPSLLLSPNLNVFHHRHVFLSNSLLISMYAQFPPPPPPPVPSQLGGEREGGALLGVRFFLRFPPMYAPPQRPTCVDRGLIGLIGLTSCLDIQSCSLGQVGTSASFIQPATTTFIFATTSTSFCHHPCRGGKPDGFHLF